MQHRGAAIPPSPKGLGFLAVKRMNLKEITYELEVNGYQLRYFEPQTVCEIFLTSSGDFKIFRTAICTISKLGEKKRRVRDKTYRVETKGTLFF